MITGLLAMIQGLLKEQMDCMKDNYERAEWLDKTFKACKLGEDLQEPIIKWFLTNY